MAQFITQQTENKYEAIKELQNSHLDCSFTLGTESAHVRKVTIQLKFDKSQASIAVRRAVLAYLSDDTNGDSIAASAPSSGWAIATNGLLIPVVTNKAAFFTSEATGIIDINITEATAKSFYLLVVMPNGRLVSSGAIAFAG